MRRISFLLYVFILGILFCSATSAETTEQEVFTAGNYQYVLLPDETAEIRKYTGAAEALTIPSDLNGVKVTSIGKSAFYKCLSFTSVIIPDSVISIGDSAFDRCHNLISVTIPDSVTSIEDNAFYACNRLSSITIPDSVIFIGKNPFCNCESLSSIIVSPDHPVLATISNVLFRK